ncbi:hypothetical protein DY023_14715 [Microbacterium bovistercoris]|uniref:PKD domain-containing protein n=1 Tax=Microbacterium bovistercoris TaxID=2293570 RepID=A0A371NRH1_9MICO|nr:hypothetical protein DY023_14715 [Microbacterium bovistercoris]
MDVTGKKTKPGSDGSESGSDQADGDRSGAVDASGPQFPVFPEESWEKCDDEIPTWRGCYLPIEDDADPTDQPPASTPGIPAITITDLASFAPEAATLTGEPENLGVVGLPTNMVADAGVHTETGTLFSFPIAVRFTPATYTFVNGDNTTTKATTGGASWADLRQAQFTPTATSHTYTARGTYAARVDIAYTAEIDLGTGWFPITGTLTTTGADQQIRIFEAHTALVAHTCNETPTAPGC